MQFLEYPFKSKTKQSKYAKINPDATIPDRIPDKKIKPMKKYMRPNFAPEPYSWEMDFIVGQGRNKSYLIFININTRYVYAIPANRYVTNRGGVPRISRMIGEFLNLERRGFNHPVKNIKADKDTEFKMLPARLKPLDINVYLQDSQFSYHNKQVDSIIRTLRNALGPNTNHLWDGLHDEIIQQLVSYYNNTHHNAINTTPLDMHQDIDKEWAYIRKMTETVNEIKGVQRVDGLKGFTPGTMLMVYLDFDKTNAKHMKRRRTFNYLARFKEYRNGNAVVELEPHIMVGEKRYGIIEVPLFHCVKVDNYTETQRDNTFFNDEELRQDLAFQRKMGAPYLRFGRYI